MWGFWLAPCCFAAPCWRGTATCRPLHHPLRVLPCPSGASQANCLMAGPAFLNAYKCQKDVLLLAVPTLSPCRPPSSRSTRLSWALSGRQVAGTAGSTPGLSTLSAPLKGAFKILLFAGAWAVLAANWVFASAPSAVVEQGRGQLARELLSRLVSSHSRLTLWC